MDPRLAKAVRFVSLDVDGVLTDGSIWVGSDSLDGDSADPPLDLRRFHALDGLAIRMMQRSGLMVVFLSGRRSAAVRLRARELNIEEVSLGSRKGKLSALRGMLARRDCTWDQAAHLGDDLTDLAVMERVGFPAAVVGAVPEVRGEAVWVGTVPGGKGAVREFAEALLVARGEWEGLVAEFREGGRFGS
ncbi:KdsC family phosphatase [Candidatus Palauibacter sp.]|uniref:KdsC family phosphatase n=1 Tax=Candidatus Palauibacter sp. TaxID=3101350 RepID=UPI003B51EA39